MDNYARVFLYVWVCEPQLSRPSPRLLQSCEINWFVCLVKGENGFVEKAEKQHLN